RVNAIALQVDAVPEALGVLIHTICAEGHFVVEGLVKIHRDPFVVEGTGQQRNLAQRRESRFFGHPVDHASATTAAEDHGVGTSQNLYAIHVVEIAIILNVVPHAIKKEVRGRAVTPKDDLVTIIFALMGGNAGHITNYVADAQHLLILDLL